MMPSIRKTLTELTGLPNSDRGPWLVGAEEGVRFLTQNRTADKIVLYASGRHLLFNSVLVSRAAVTPPDHDDLANAHIMIDDTWSIQRVYGGGEGHRIYLEPPLSHCGCKTLVGAEQLVFRRSFDGVKSYIPTVELSQKLVHSLGLHYVDERNAYCRLDQRGDLEDVIRVWYNDVSDPRLAVCAVSILSRDLATYMALSGTSLVTKFDFTRFSPGGFTGWEGGKERIHQAADLFYRHRVIPNHASYTRGQIILHTKLTEADLVAEWKAEEDDSKKQYASFKIRDCKNNRLVETSCGPEHIVNYFTKSELPWEISPAFFRPDVLQKYKVDPEKYTIGDRSIGCRGAWYLKTYDINEAGQVHTYICYLANLPFEEQLYWQSFNEWPKANISKRAYENDILGAFSSDDDPLADVKSQVDELDRDCPAWWQHRGKALADGVLHPATDSVAEWGSEILALDHLLVEGFQTKGLRGIISANGGNFEKDWGSLKLLEVALSLTGRTDEQAKELVEPLKELHFLRNPAKAHGDTIGRQTAVASARKRHGTLRNHFLDLTTRIRDAIKQIIPALPRE